MNRHINDSLKWKYLAGLISESQYNEEIAQAGQSAIPSTPQKQTPNQPQAQTGDEKKETEAAEQGLKNALDATVQNLASILVQTQKVSKTQNVQESEDFDQEDFDLDTDYVDLDLNDTFDYKYHTFQEFVDTNYGSDLSLAEKVKAIEQWATGYNIGENPGDFQGVAENMTPELLDALKTSQVSKIFIDELEDEIKSSEDVGMLAESSEELNEVVATLAGAALSAPALLQLAGKVGKWTGKKINSQWLQDASDNVAHAGHKLHHAYLGVIEKALRKLFPQAPDDAIKTASNAIFLAVVAGFAVDAGLHAANAFSSGHLLGAGVEGGLAGVKSSEVVKDLPQILAKLGLLTAKAA